MKLKPEIINLCPFLIGKVITGRNEGARGKARQHRVSIPNR